jgi:gluconolactonase
MPLLPHATSISYEAKLLITDFHGRPFNSPNDVVVHSDGSIWFTDPMYGWEQGIRPKPRLPNQIYRYDTVTGGIRAIADGFGKPNGICFSPNETIVYVTDTDWIHLRWWD